MTTVDRRPMTDLVDAVRQCVRRGESPERTAASVADALRPFLASPDLLRAEDRVADPDRYTQHVMHVEGDGSFSIVSLVWLPGQVTPVHDHLAWCVAGVYEGCEFERRYALAGPDDNQHLVSTVDGRNRAGETSGFAPPGDIHQVSNCGDTTAISLHVYGADIGQLGTSVRRTYDLPVRHP